MGCVRPVRAAFSPLDEELQLLPGSLSPWTHECLVRLGAWMPFEPAARLLEAFTGVGVSEFTARESSEAAGAAQVALQTEAVERLEREAPPAPPGPAKQYLSADGAFVPLVGGQWAEVKTLVLGEVGQPVQEKGEWVVYTQQLSYFSRLAEADTFARLALVETHRRGVAKAAQVAAIQDGAQWLQGLVDWHRPDALRILDFPHAGGYVAKIGQAAFGADTPELASWLKAQLHTLKHEGPAKVLAELPKMVVEHPEAQGLELPQALAYLQKRQGQMQYPTFQAQGWPIGSGATESGNKLVVEARLKGAGMHWARGHVNPMLALRNIVCNDRWEEAWPQIEAHLCAQTRQQRLARHRERRALSATLVEMEAQGAPKPPPKLSPGAALARPEVPVSVLQAPHRPAPSHPWRRAPIGRARYRSARAEAVGKL
jgi:hypothetical protein